MYVTMLLLVDLGTFDDDNIYEDSLYYGLTNQAQSKQQERKHAKRSHTPRVVLVDGRTEAKAVSKLTFVGFIFFRGRESQSLLAFQDMRAGQSRGLFQKKLKP